MARLFQRGSLPARFRLHVLLVTTLVGLFPVTVRVPVCVKGQWELFVGAVAGQVLVCVFLPALSFSGI